MPLYDLVAIVKAAAPRTAVAEVLRRAAVGVMDAGGVVTDVKSYGLRDLAYSIRKAGETHVQVRRSWQGEGWQPPRDGSLRAALTCAPPLPQGQYVQLSVLSGP